MCNKIKIYTILLISFATLLFSVNASASNSDSYIQGYTEALLKIKLNIEPGAVLVRDGVISLNSADIEGVDSSDVISELLNIEGVKRVEILEQKPEEPGPEYQEREKIGTQANETVKKQRLFEPLIADPRWPHFSIAYQYYIDDDELKNAGATSFGETLPFYRDTAPFGGTWEVGIQAAVFALFDLDSDSSDLINADYIVGIPLSYRKGAFSAITRLFHQSSHLGDEFLLRSRVDRINLSYEAVDARISYDMKDWLRIYGGAGYIVHKEPDDLEPWSIQYGFELRSRKKYWDTVSPVFGTDLKTREEASWETDVSLQAGFQFESEKTAWNDLQVTLQYFNGYSPNGQFYDRRIEYLSLGSHFYFQ